MRIFDKIKHIAIEGEEVKIYTHYYFLNWNFWTSQKVWQQEPINQILKVGKDGQMERDEQAEYLGII